MAPKADKLAVTTSGKQGQSISSGEVKSKSSYYDKQSDSYGRVTTKQSVSSGDYTNRGRDGHKYEFKASTTERVGDKRGYTEFSKQEKFIRVDYGGGNKFGGYGVRGGGCSFDAQDDDGCSSDSSEFGACCEDVNKDDPCDDNEDFDDDDDNDDFDDDDDDNDDFDDDDNDDYDNASVDDDCYYDSDY